MIVFFGSRLYGKSDQVPGLFYVATNFAYIQFLPLAPTESFLIFDDGGDRGVKIKMSGKSVLFGYLRAGLIVLAGILGFLGVLGLGSDRLTGVLLFLAALVAVLFFFASYKFTHAGRTRALKLAEEAGIHPSYVHRHFDRLEGRESSDRDYLDDEDYPDETSFRYTDDDHIPTVDPEPDEEPRPRRRPD